MSAIVITGVGLATCLGLSAEEAWQQVLQGKCGIRPLAALEVPGKVGGQALDLPAGFEADQSREVRYLKWTIRQAIEQANFGNAYAPERCGVMLGTTLHGMRSAGDFLRSGNYEPLKNFLATSVLKRALDGLNIEGFEATTCSACSSSLGSIALAMTLLESGQLDLVIAGGYDTISEYAYGGFNSLRLVAEGPQRPFARDRQGMKLAEGYGIVILERASDAAKRNARVIAEVAGFGETADAHHLTQPHPEGDGAARAIAAALASAKVSSDKIDFIAAHATATPDNDSGEYAALSRVFAARLSEIPVVGFKSHLGHTLGGAGAVELILSAMALRDQVVPPCANSTKEDVEFSSLNLSTGSAQKHHVQVTLNTSLGFGGANTCVILRKHHGVSIVAPKQPRKVFISGIGVILPGVNSRESFLAKLAQPSPVLTDSPQVDESQYLHLLNARRVRRMSPYVKMTLAATALALQHANVTDIPLFAETCSAILGSTHGSTDYSLNYYTEIVKQGFIGANPMLFAEGVPNAAAAHLSLMLSLKRGCQTIIGSRTSGLDALGLASMRIASGQWDRAIVSAGEESHELVNKAYEFFGLHGGENGFASSCGAVTFIIESQSSLDQRDGGALAELDNFATARGSAAAEKLKQRFSDCRHILSCANGTRLDGLEEPLIRSSSQVSKIYPHFGEVFSAMPLLALARQILENQWREALTVCSDYTGLLSAIRGRVL